MYVLFVLIVSAQVDDVNKPIKIYKNNISQLYGFTETGLLENISLLIISIHYILDYIHY